MKLVYTGPHDIREIEIEREDGDLSILVFVKGKPLEIDEDDAEICVGYAGIVHYEELHEGQQSLLDSSE